MATTRLVAERGPGTDENLCAILKLMGRKMVKAGAFSSRAER